MRLCNVWIESDSLQLVRAFNHDASVPKGFNTTCTHIPREGNRVADALANNGHGLPSYTSQWWNEPPLFLGDLPFRDSTAMLLLGFHLCNMCIRFRPHLTFIF